MSNSKKPVCSFKQRQVSLSKPSEHTHFWTHLEFGFCLRDLPKLQSYFCFQWLVREFHVSALKVPTAARWIVYRGSGTGWDSWVSPSQLGCVCVYMGGGVHTLLLLSYWLICILCPGKVGFTPGCVKQRGRVTLSLEYNPLKSDPGEARCRKQLELKNVVLSSGLNATTVINSVLTGWGQLR